MFLALYGIIFTTTISTSTHCLAQPQLYTLEKPSFEVNSTQQPFDFFQSAKQQELNLIQQHENDLFKTQEDRRHTANMSSFERPHYYLINHDTRALNLEENTSRNKALINAQREKHFSDDDFRFSKIYWDSQKH